MSSDSTGRRGVVNHMGEIFKGPTSETHEGLIVSDGAVVPAALGVNPLATITAIAERTVELVAMKHGITIDYETKNGTMKLIRFRVCAESCSIRLTLLGLLDVYGTPAYPQPRDESLQRLSDTIVRAEAAGTSGVGFSEVMTGFIHAGPDLGDYDIATDVGRSRGEAARFFLSVKSWNAEDCKLFYTQRGCY